MLEIGFSSLYQKGLSKIYSLERLRLLEMGETIPLKRDRSRWKRAAVMVGIIVKERNSKKFLIVYFHLRFSIT